MQKRNISISEQFIYRKVFLGEFWVRQDTVASFLKSFLDKSYVSENTFFHPFYYALLCRLTEVLKKVLFSGM